MAAAFWALARSGTGILPGVEHALDSAAIWPQRPQSELAWFVADSPIGLIAFKALGLTSGPQFHWLHIAVIVIAIGLLAVWAYGSVHRGLAARLSVLAVNTRLS